VVQAIAVPPVRGILLEPMYKRLMQVALRKRKQARGFTMVELLVVMTIVLCISAFAIPNFMVGIANLRLRSGMSSLSALMQNCRMQAIKKNRNTSVHFTIMSGGPTAFIKDSTAGTTIANTDQQIQMGAPVIMNQAPSGTDAPSLLGNTELGFDPNTSDPAFNPRGLPCLYDSGSCTPNVGFVFYFTDTRPLGKNGWGAVTISPAGHVKTWMWNGTSWGN
jgi:prepilin-type N-terminal cleavage/methylation domain-containing protein